MIQQSRPLFPAVLTILAVAVSIVGAFIGSGALAGTPIREAAGGWLSADATPLAPASSAFSIWSVIYIGLVGYALWQLAPAARGSSRQRSVRPWAILSVLLNAAWIWMVQLGSLVGSVIVIVALLVVLIRILVLMVSSKPAGWVETLLTDGTFGLYLGWVCVATVANISSLTAASGADAFAAWRPAAAGVVVLAALIGIATALWSRGRLAPALATSWGLTWIAVGRLDGGLESAFVAWFAGPAAAAVLGTAVIVRLTRGTRRTAASGESTRG